MSPIDETGTARVIRDADSFFRDHRGLLSMGHLAAFVAIIVAALYGVGGLFGFITGISDWTTAGNLSVALFGLGVGIEYGTGRIEQNLQLGRHQS